MDPGDVLSRFERDFDNVMLWADATTHRALEQALDPNRPLRPLAPPKGPPPTKAKSPFVGQHASTAESRELLR